jgi:hypothetical protein
VRIAWHFGVIRTKKQLGKIWGNYPAQGEAVRLLDKR